MKQHQSRKWRNAEKPQNQQGHEKVIDEDYRSHPEAHRRVITIQGTTGGEGGNGDLCTEQEADPLKKTTSSFLNKFFRENKYKKTFLWLFPGSRN